MHTSIGMKRRHAHKQRCNHDDSSFGGQQCLPGTNVIMTNACLLQPGENVTDGGARTGSGSVNTEKQPDRGASAQFRLSNNSSSARDGDINVETATPASVQTAAAPPVVVQVEDSGMHTSDGEIKVHTTAASPSQRVVKPAAPSVEVTEGDKGVADGSVKVEVAAGTAAKAAEIYKPMFESDAGRARSDTEAMPEPYKPGSQSSRVSNWLVTDASQAGSEVAAADTASADLESNAKAAVDGMGSEEADDHSVQVIVDASLLG